MIPASTTKLRPGDVCFIPRSNGGFVAFVYVCAPAKSRSALYGSLVDAIVDEPKLELMPQKLSILKPALVHISSYRENNTPIVGNVADRIGEHTLRKAAAEATSTAVGSVSKVWGHKTILKYADAVA
jgi:hypothetical protein